MRCPSRPRASFCKTLRVSRPWSTWPPCVTDFLMTFNTASFV
jgi:hypothetical protein